MTKLKAGIISAVVVAGAATPLVTQHQAQVKLREENRALRQEVAQRPQLQSENERLSSLIAQANGASALSREQVSELMKLRAEVGWLRKQTNELAKLEDENRQLRARPVVVQAAALAQSPAVQPPQSEQNACVNNLREIDSAVQQFALEYKLSTNDVVTAEQIVPYLRSGQLPRCPSGGTYTFGPVTNAPSCSIPGHTLQ